MLFVKLLGAGLLVLVGGYGALLLNRRAEREVDRMDAWISLLRLVKNQIDCYALPLSEILLRASPPLLSRIGWDADGAPNGFDAIGAVIGDTGMSEEGERVARFFCEEIGKGYRAEQLHTCDYAIGLFCAERDRLLSQLGGARKRNTTLCLCGAVALAIVLL